MAKGKLFEYAVLYHPRPTKEQHDRGEVPDSVLVTPPTVKLATSDDAVSIMAARSMPEEHTSHLDDIEICVRPF